MLLYVWVFCPRWLIVILCMCPVCEMNIHCPFNLYLAVYACPHNHILLYWQPDEAIEG